MSSSTLGRYSLIDPEGARRHLFGDPGGDVPEANAYIVPGTDVLAGGRSTEGEIRAAILHWGISPDPDDSSRLMATAQSETIARDPGFKESFQRRRCLIAADGFYEWGEPEDGPQVVWKFGAPEGGYLAFAGVYQPLRSANGGGPATGCVIVTTAANELVGQVHNRMPAILDPSDFDAWLDPDTPRSELLDMLQPAQVEGLEAEELDPVP